MLLSIRRLLFWDLGILEQIEAASVFLREMIVFRKFWLRYFWILLEFYSSIHSCSIVVLSSLLIWKVLTFSSFLSMWKTYIHVYYHQSTKWRINIFTGYFNWPKGFRFLNIWWNKKIARKTITLWMLGSWAPKGTRVVWIVLVNGM